jgi:hypothetical protein
MPAAETRTVVVVDSDPGWERVGLAAARIARMHPKDVPRLPPEASPIVVNLAAAGTIEQLASWPASAGPPCGCVTVPGSDRMVMLRGVAVVSALRPADPIAVHVRRRRRSARVVAAGANAGALLALRRVLGADGIGVSLAWDALQAEDLCDLVHPHVVVLDLALPRGGHELVVRLGLRPNVPDLVLQPAGSDGRAFANAFERAHRRVVLPMRRDALAWLLDPHAARRAARSRSALLEAEPR